MQIKVTPMYGYGWLRDRGIRMEVPAPFVMDSTILTPGVSFKEAFGFVAKDGHELNGLWVYLSLRTSADDPTYNLSAFRNRPNKVEDFRTARSIITGFATAS